MLNTLDDFPGAWQASAPVQPEQTGYRTISFLPPLTSNANEWSDTPANHFWDTERDEEANIEDELMEDGDEGSEPAVESQQATFKASSRRRQHRDDDDEVCVMCTCA